MGRVLTNDEADRLADALRAAGYTADAVVELLGDEAAGALARGERVPALRATRGGSPVETLIRLFLLGTTEPAGMRWSAAVDGAVAALVAGCDGTHPLGELAAVLELAYGIESGQVAAMARGLAEHGYVFPSQEVG
jgi:hypothetical protein